MLLDIPHLIPDNSFLTCLLYQRSVAIFGLSLIWNLLMSLYNTIQDGGIKHSIGPFVGFWVLQLNLKMRTFRYPYKYLRFEWNSTLFEFICLPFGLSSAPRVFTKVLKSFFASIRNKGVRLVIYIDDMAIISSSRELSSQEAATVVHILESLRFIINKEKWLLIHSHKYRIFG